MGEGIGGGGAPKAKKEGGGGAGVGRVMLENCMAKET